MEEEELYKLDFNLTTIKAHARGYTKIAVNAVKLERLLNERGYSFDWCNPNITCKIDRPGRAVCQMTEEIPEAASILRDFQEAYLSYSHGTGRKHLDQSIERQWITGDPVSEEITKLSIINEEIRYNERQIEGFQEAMLKYERDEDEFGMIDAQLSINNHKNLINYWKTKKIKGLFFD